jgi:hypothetical protein
MDGGSVTKIVCILGMHRSGTSCLAGSLEEAGLRLGEVNTTAAHNIKGNRENKRIWELHDAVLADNGGSWSQPPGHVRWSDARRLERDAIIRSYGDASNWGFKDPRSLLLLDFWREAVPHLTFVGTFRHPRLVADSLYRREGRQVEYWKDLWVYYNARLLELHRVHPFPIIRFDVGEEAYRRSVAVVTHGIGLSPPERMEFFEPALRHHDSLPTPSDSTGGLYESLCQIAIDPGMRFGSSS